MLGIKHCQTSESHKHLEMMLFFRPIPRYNFFSDHDWKTTEWSEWSLHDGKSWASRSRRCLDDKPPILAGICRPLPHWARVECKGKYVKSTKHNSPIFDKCKTQSLRVFALSWKRAHYDKTPRCGVLFESFWWARPSLWHGGQAHLAAFADWVWRVVQGFSK